jgi:hypothetical protein
MVQGVTVWKAGSAIAENKHPQNPEAAMTSKGSSLYTSIILSSIVINIAKKVSAKSSMETPKIVV